jgi:sigma-B regulation protein RsbU (phosphoserine phosphatase)
LADTRLSLTTGDTLILYTDGFTEARAPDGQTPFGAARLRQEFGGSRTQLPLEICAEHARAAVEAFTGSADLQDDLTLLLLRQK